MIRVAFPLIGRAVWTGGYVYLRNTLRLVRSRLEGELSASVFLAPDEDAAYGDELRALADGRVRVDPAFAGWGRGPGLARALATGRDAAAEGALGPADCLFEVAAFYGWRPGLPVLSWMPDFQHRHMPEMFRPANRLRRELGFRAQVASGRTVMLSSRTAEADCLRFYPAARGRTRVVRFAADIDVAEPFRRAADARARHGIEGPFVYLPNQSWKHKNHATVLEALALLRDEGRLDAVPPVVMSGLPRDPRNPGHHEALEARARSLGLQDRFRHLGLIDYADVLALAAGCAALLNPSLFEGWSTPIEEAKALGAPLLLSDIPIHREQAPHARFFDPRSPRALADALLGLASDPPPPRADAAALRAAQDRRLDDHAAALLDAVRAAVAGASPTARAAA
jgi:glycosyltransferase involved in cell wall biosynthesis